MKQFNQLTSRNIMCGVLLAPGPISTLKSVKSLSRVFKDGVSITKFLTAAKKLEDAGFGALKILENIGRSSRIFLKKSPAEIQHLLLLPEFSDICTPETYEVVYSRPTSNVITRTIKQAAVDLGLVKPELFQDLFAPVVKSEVNLFPPEVNSEQNPFQVLYASQENS